MPGAAARRPARSHWPAAVLAVIAAAIAVLAHLHLFPAYSWNRDEPVYLWHMEVLRAGRLTAGDGGHPGLFLPWLSGHADGELFTQYTIGWPAVLLAARLVTGTAAAALPLAAALAVTGTYALAFELTARRRVATLAGGLFVASPIVAIQGGVYLSYLFTLGVGLIAGALLLSGVRRDRPGRHLVAGGLFGLVFLTRPYDALLWAAAFALGLVLARPDARRATVRALGLSAVAAAPFVVLALLYNRRITGELLTFPVTAKDPLDGFGFGDRRLAPGFEAVDYTPWRALRATAKNGVLLPWFLVGGYLGVVAAAAGLWIRRREPATRVLLLVAAVFPLGYFVFWGTFLSSLASRISGPIYLVPLYAVVCTLAAMAIDHWWSSRRSVAVATLVVLGLATLPGAITRFDVNREISLQQQPWRTSVEGIPEPALVFVADTSTHLLYTNPFASNPPDLDGEVLYAVAGRPEMLDLIAEHPDRSPFLQQGSVSPQDLGPLESPRQLDVDVDPIRIVRGRELRVSVTVAPPPGEPVVDLRVSSGGHEVRRTVTADRGPVTVDVALGGSGPGSLPVDRHGLLTVTIGYGSTEAAARERGDVRRLTPYRVGAEILEVVTPLLGQRSTAITDQRREWRHERDLTALEVTVATAG
jgi:hypothetical protein